MKAVYRKYAFDLPISKNERKYLKVKYDFKFPAFKADSSGNNFDCILGTTYTALELFIIKRRIYGPCWLTIKNA